MICFGTHIIFDDLFWLLSLSLQICLASGNHFLYLILTTITVTLHITLLSKFKFQMTIRVFLLGSCGVAKLSWLHCFFSEKLCSGYCNVCFLIMKF